MDDKTMIPDVKEPAKIFVGAKELRRVPCPECGKKGLHYAMHPHAFGWKDYGRIVCRFCSATFKRKEVR